MSGGLSAGDAIQDHPFICKGCHVRYAHAGTCQLCGSEIVAKAEWSEPPAPPLLQPERKPHKVMAGLALGAAALSIPLAWGEPTLWGVLPCVLLTIVLVVLPPAKSDDLDFDKSELSGYVEGAPRDKQGVPWGMSSGGGYAGSARLGMSARGIGVFIVLLAGTLVPLAAIQWDRPATIVAGFAAILGFVLASIRRIGRAVEPSAARGVPL